MNHFDDSNIFSVAAGRGAQHTPTAAESAKAFWDWCAQYKREHGREPTRTEAWHAATLAAIAEATESAT